MDPLQWMGAVRMRDQTADKNITIFLEQFWTFFTFKHWLVCAYFSLYTEESNIMDREHCILARSNGLKLKTS